MNYLKKNKIIYNIKSPVNNTNVSKTKSSSNVTFVEINIDLCIIWQKVKQKLKFLLYQIFYKEIKNMIKNQMMKLKNKIE